MDRQSSSVWLQVKCNLMSQLVFAKLADLGRLDAQLSTTCCLKRQEEQQKTGCCDHTTGTTVHLH